MMKARLAGAHKGHGLLKKKADALQMRFRLILGKIIEVRENLNCHHHMIKIFFYYNYFRLNNLWEM